MEDRMIKQEEYTVFLTVLAATIKDLDDWDFSPDQFFHLLEIKTEQFFRDEIPDLAFLRSACHKQISFLRRAYDLHCDPKATPRDVSH